MIIFKKSQVPLFDTPVHVDTHVRTDGVVVHGHTRIQKKRAPEHHAHRPGRLDHFINHRGGPKEFGRVLSNMTAAQQQRLYAEMAKLDGVDPDAVAARFKDVGAAPEPVPDMFSSGKVATPKYRKGDIVEFIDKNKKQVGARVESTEGDTVMLTVVDREARSAFKVGGSVRRPIDGLTLRAKEKPVAEARPAPAPKPKAKAAPAPTPAPTPAPAPAAEAHDPYTPFGVPVGTSKGGRREINAQVIAILERGEPYTAADRYLLRQYSGNGGCGDSLNEFYTDPEVARGMWATIGRLGVTHGTACEPSCATGVFMHTAPAGMRVTGVELEPVSAGVALALHGERHEIHTASFERFATSDDRQFDVVIGNPPYGPRGFLAKDDKVGLSTAEAYFVDTALDKAKPGGIVALVLPTGIMDSRTNRTLREMLLVKGEFLGAQRMPNTAFEHSHTEVTTDVVYFRKRPDDVAAALATVDQPALQKLGVWDEEFLAGSYFTGRGASNVLGTMGPGWRAQAGMGDDITVSGSMAGVPQAIADFHPDSVSRPAAELTVQDVADALEHDLDKARAVAAARRDRPYLNTAKVGDTKIVDGITYILQGDPPRWHRVDEFMQAPAIADAQDIAAEIDRLFTGGAVDRPALETAIKAYVEKYGVPADNPDFMTAAMADKKLYRLVGAVNRKGELSDAVLGKAPRKVEGSFEATAEALSLERNGSFTAAELAERLGKEADQVEDQLAADGRYATVGDGRWAMMDTYLTGELWPKLDAARAALEAGGELQDKLRDQVARLEKLLDPKALDDVDFQLNSAFLPLHTLEAFFNWKQFDAPEANEWTKKQKPVSIEFSDGVYTITGGSGYGDSKLLDKYLNRTGVRKDDVDKVDALNAEFKSWLCASTYRDAVEELYNRKFRGFVPVEYSDAPIDVPGLTTDKDVRSWRWSSLRRSLAVGKGIIADDVGLGKTLGGLLLARMAKLQGTAKRPMITVPKSVLANWYEESQLWFPGSRVLTIGANFAFDKNGELVGRDDDAIERKRKWHDLTQNDYDFIFVSEPAFEEVDLNPETKEEYYSQDFWVQRGESLGNAGDKRRKAIKERFEQHLASREFQDRTDAIWFDDLGVDMLIADEMHHQKNLYAARARFGENPKFLGGQGLSNRALDFNLKTRWIREHNGGRGVHGLTATPTKNSPLEIYSMLSHVAPEAFENIGIRNSEEFLDRFCEFTNDKVLSTSGEIEDALVVSGFKNLTELREIMARYIDRRTAEQVGLKLPEREVKTHLVEMSKAQEAVYADLRDLANKSGKKKDATGDSHIFSIMDKMNKAALDLELLGAEHAGATSNKYIELAKQAAAGVKDGGQLIFCEAIAAHDKIVRALVDQGFKRSEIGVINAQVAASSVKRQNIAEAFNRGKLKAVIGNCTMAEGLNMQKTTTDIHELDIPWEPATVQQRLGRGIRQGNLNEAVRTHSYLSKGSFDGYRYQAVHAKRDWQDLLWNGGDRVENLAREGALTLDDMRIMLAADPEDARKKFEEDKTAAMQRYEAGARTDAQAQFVRFQDLHRSYGQMRNKETISGRRLRDKLESAKTSLFNNKYWPAKAALDSASDVLVHPKTGLALHAGVAFNATREDNEGKFVVTGVNMRDRTVSVRRYADNTGAPARTVPLDVFADGISPFKLDEKAEAAEVAAKFEEAAEKGLNSLSKWKDVLALPSSVIEANADLIQRQVKDGAKAYTFDMGHSGKPMVDKATGKLEMVDYPSLKHDTHDYVLPTDANKELIKQAWLEAERGKKFGHTYHQKRKNSRSEVRNQVEYPGARYNSKTMNPWYSAVSDMSPRTQHGSSDGTVERELKDRFKKEQLERVRRAPTFQAALSEAVPLADFPGYGAAEGVTPKWDKRALAVLWARARAEGVLGKKMSEFKPAHHDGYALHNHATGYGGREMATVHSALRDIAHASEHKDLAAAMASSGVRHGHEQPAKALTMLDQLGIQEGAASHYQNGRGPRKYPPGVLQSMLNIAERSNIANMAVRDAGVSSWGVLSNGSANGHKTVRQAITEAMEAAS